VIRPPLVFPALDMTIGSNEFGHTILCYLGLTCFFNKPMHKRGPIFYINHQCVLKLVELTEKILSGLVYLLRFLKKGQQMFLINPI
jgi:hypothetical protein